MPFLRFCFLLVFLTGLIGCEEPSPDSPLREPGQTKQTSVLTPRGEQPAEPSTHPQNASSLTLVRGGKPASVIVIPDHPMPVEQFAAEELQYHLRKASGAELEIVTESAAPAETPWVALGATKLASAARKQLADLPPNSFVVARQGDRLILAGDDTDGPVGHKSGTLHNNRTRVGTLFAVYDILENQLGCKWLWPGELGEVIAQRETIGLETTVRTHSPNLIHKRFRDYGMKDHIRRGFATRADADRFFRDQAVWLRRHRFAMGADLDIRHAFTKWWDRYGEEHPEYFNKLPDGTRRPDPVRAGGSPKLVTMCVSNEEFQEKVVELWKQNRKPGQHTFDVSENDGRASCTCEACMALDEPHPSNPVPMEERLAAARKAFNAGDKDWTDALGSLSDRYARFMLAVQKQAEQIDPEVMVMNHAYSNYVLPPQNTKLNERCIFAIVPPYQYPWVTQEELDQSRAIWDGWAAAGARLLLRPNYMRSGHGMPLIQPDVVGREFQHAFNHGLIGTDFGRLTGQFAAQGPALYMLVRKHTHPNRPVEDILAEFYDGFGPASQAVEKYFTWWNALSKSLKSEEVGPGLDYRMLGPGYLHRLMPKIVTPERLRTCWAMLDKALADAKGDPQATARVEFVRMGLTHMDLMSDVQRRFDAYQVSGDIWPYFRALKKLDDYRRNVLSKTNASHMGFLEGMENYTWDRSMLEFLGSIDTDAVLPLPQDWRFRFDPENVGLKNGWFKPETEDDDWSSIEVTDVWENQLVGKTWKAEHGHDYDGFGWYRLRFSLPAKPKPGTRYRLLFGAVDEACTVWVNGKKVLDRPYPYQGRTDSWSTPFEVDFTAVAKPGKENVLAVRVEDNSGHGGIWKPVQLVAGVSAPREKNLVSNGGFEAKTPAPWKTSVMEGTYQLEVDRKIAHSGRASGRIICKQLDPQGEKLFQKGWARWIQKVPVEPGRAHRMELYFRSDPQFKGRVHIWCHDPNRKAVRTARMLSTDGRWVKVVIDGYRPTTETATLYVNSLGGTGTIWIDDVQLIESKGQ